MTQPNAIDKFFDSVEEAYDIMLDTLKSATDRGYRVSKGVIEQVQSGQREALHLAQSVAKSPTDLAQTSSAVVQSLTKAQGRMLELSRQWLDEAMDSQQEGRDAVRRLIDANRRAGEAALEASRGLFGQARERARQYVRPGRDGDGAKPESDSRTRRARTQTAEEPKTGSE